MIHLLETYWMYLFAWFILTALGYFGGYLFIKWADKHRNREKWWFKYPMYGYGFIFIVFLDFPFQVLSTGIFWTPPRNWLFTGRMKRYKKMTNLHYLELDGYQYMIAQTAYDNLSGINQLRYDVAVGICTWLNKNGQVKPYC